MDKENKDQILKELDDFRKVLSYYAKNRYEDNGPDLSDTRKQLNRMLPKIKKYIMQAKIPTQISGRAPMTMGGAPFTMDIFDDMFLNERGPLAVNLDNTLDAVDKCIGRFDAGLEVESRLDKCGPLGNKTCNQREFIEKEYSDKNVFLDIPYNLYKEREAIIQEVISVAGLVAIVAGETLTSNVVICKVCKFIQKCKYGVADISFNRPSVTYELGLMHGFGFKVCILLQENLPKFSDIEGLEHASYVNDLELRIKLARWLEHNVPETTIPKIKEYISDVEKRLSEGKGKPYSLPIIKKNTNEDLKDKILVSKQFSDKRLEEIKSEIKNKKSFILSATPIPLKDEIIDTNSQDVRGLFAKPGYSRGHGWNMSAPREACNVQLVKIQYGERLATTPEPTFAPDRATCRREAKGRGYRATTQVKGLSPEINHCVGGRYCSYSIRQNSYSRKWQGSKSPTGSETVALYQRGIAGTWENRYIADRACDNKPINGKDAQIIYRWSDKPIVAMKFRNGNGAKGLTERPLEGEVTARLRTGEQLLTEPNPETSSMEGDVFPKSRVRENCKHGSVRGLVASSDENKFIRRWL